MIPQNFKDILTNGDHAGLYQTIAMLLFILLFLGIVYYVFSKPKKYFSEAEEAPLEDDQTFNL